MRGKKLWPGGALRAGYGNRGGSGFRSPLGPGGEFTVVPLPGGGDCCVIPCCLFGVASPQLYMALPGLVTRAALGTRVRPEQHRLDLPPDGAVARLLHRGVRFYQAELSSLTPRCPHTPSCSQYAAQALRRHGAGRGSWLTVRRLLRCRPGTAGGLDLVP
jgi:putative membrane protein insertion efficiency factor